MNKKKNQTSIDLDAIMTEVLNLFTPEERTIARKQPPLQLTCKGFGICKHAKTTHLTSLKKIARQYPLPN